MVLPKEPLARPIVTVLSFGDRVCAEPKPEAPAPNAYARPIYREMTERPRWD